MPARAELPQHQQHQCSLRRSKAPARRTGGDAAPGAQHQQKQAVAAGRGSGVLVGGCGSRTVTSLRKSFFKKPTQRRYADPARAACRRAAWLGWQAQRIGWNVWGRGSCCPPGLHCRTAPAPAAPHKGPGAATAPARRAMGMLHPVQYNTQVKTGSSSWSYSWSRQRRAHVAAQSFVEKRLRSGDTPIPQGLLRRRAALARLAGPAHWLERLGPG